MNERASSRVDGGRRPLVEVGLLGTLTLTVDGAAVPVPGPLRRSILARLAIDSPRPVAVDALLFDLWPNRDESQAVTSLRTYVSQLRRLVGADRIVTGPVGYAFDAGDEEVDARAFTRAMTHAAAITEPPQLVAALDRALGLWRGTTPLADFSAMPWAQAAASRLSDLRLGALTRLYDARLDLGEAAALCAELTVLVTQHPLHEPFWGQLMVAQYRSGRQADALRSYQRVRQILADELGIGPGPALAALELSVLQQDPSLLGPAAAETPPEPGRTPVAARRLTESCLCWVDEDPPPLVGREAELAELLTALRIEGDEPSGVVVLGEPGAGKTRLMAEAARVLDAEGHFIVHGRPDEQFGRPYPAVAEILGHLDRHAPNGLVGLVGPRLRDSLALFNPELLADPQGTDPGQATEPALALAADALYAALVEAAAGRHVVMVLDDAQWSRGLGVRLFQRFVSREFPSGISVVVIARSTGESTPLSEATVLVDAARAGRLTVIDLEGLSVAAVREVLRTAGQDEETVGHAFAERLQAESGGNALFVTEVAQHLGDLHGVDPGSTDAIPLPEGLRALIAIRVAKLGPDTTGLLQAAAVTGLRFKGAVAARAAGLDDLRAADALDAAVEARLVVERPAIGPDWYEFSHAISRQALYDNLSNARRLRLHRLIGSALEADHDRAVSAAEVARHFTQAAPLGEAGRAVRHLRLAASAAERALAHDEAAQNLDQALTIISMHPTSVQSATRCELLVDAARVRHRVGEPASAREAATEAAAWARALGRPDLLVAAALAYDDDTLSPTNTTDAAGLALLDEALTAVSDPSGRDAALLRARLARARC